MWDIVSENTGDRLTVKALSLWLACLLGISRVQALHSWAKLIEINTSQLCCADHSKNEQLTLLLQDVTPAISHLQSGSEQTKENIEWDCNQAQLYIQIACIKKPLKTVMA